MVSSLEIRDLVMNSRDACICGPLDKCEHQRAQRHTTMRQWMVGLTVINNVQNKQGRVYQCQIKQQRCVVKHFNRRNLWGHSEREQYSGENLNRLALPWFVQSLGTFYRQSGPYNVTSYVDGVLMKNSSLTPSQLLNITAQLCVALEMAQRDFYFSHYDLHLENVVLSHLRPERHMIFEEYMVHFDEDPCPVIIDFGMSCGSRDSTSWGLRGLESKSIYPKLRAGYDLFCFLLYCQQEFTSRELLTTIHYILKYCFRHDGTQHYLKSLRAHAEWVTPKQLFDFLVVNGLLPSTRVYPRNVYRWPGKATSEPSYYIDMVYDNKPYSGDVKAAIRDDIHRLLSEKDILILLEKYYKIIECQATSSYKFWVKRFTPIVNKYWVSKTKYHAKKRKLQQWL